MKLNSVVGDHMRSMEPTMSRTYRRMKGYVPFYVKEAALPLPEHETYYLYGLKKSTRYYDYRDGQWFDYSEKGLEQKNAKWFGDHGYSWRRTYGKDRTQFARQWTQEKHRQQAKAELQKYKKNPDYEVMIPRKNLLPWD